MEVFTSMGLRLSLTFSAKRPGLPSILPLGPTAENTIFANKISFFLLFLSNTTCPKKKKSCFSYLRSHVPQNFSSSNSQKVHKSAHPPFPKKVFILHPHMSHKSLPLQIPKKSTKVFILHFPREPSSTILRYRSI